VTLYLSRIRLTDAPDLAALAGQLLPGDDDQRASAAHRLLWALFADGPDRVRDFLWRDDGGDTWRRRTFLVLSARAPQDRRALFDIETKTFAPFLAPGRRLRFRLRASPAASEPRGPGQRGKRVDPVAKALSGLSPEQRAANRHDLIQEVGGRWLDRQGERAGFRVVQAADGDGGTRRRLMVDGDQWRRVRRLQGRPMTFSQLDFEGELTVEDPDLFLAALGRGFGRAKAFGCGLMLIRPA
jgi:CRISPR system Cascade subunit CasE